MLVWVEGDRDVDNKYFGIFEIMCLLARYFLLFELLAAIFIYVFFSFCFILKHSSLLELIAD